MASLFDRLRKLQENARQRARKDALRGEYSFGGRFSSGTFAARPLVSLLPHPHFPVAPTSPSTSPPTEDPPCPTTPTPPG